MINSFVKVMPLAAITFLTAQNADFVNTCIDHALIVRDVHNIGVLNRCVQYHLASGGNFPSDIKNAQQAVAFLTEQQWLEPGTKISDTVGFAPATGNQSPRFFATREQALESMRNPEGMARDVLNRYENHRRDYEKKMQQMQATADQHLNTQKQNPNGSYFIEGEEDPTPAPAEPATSYKPTFYHSRYGAQKTDSDSSD